MNNKNQTWGTTRNINTESDRLREAKNRKWLYYDSQFVK